MTLDEMMERAKSRAAFLNGPTSSEGDADATLRAAIGDVESFVCRRPNPSAAIDPNIWLIIIQAVLPILLAWIDKRFPAKPTPSPAPSVPVRMED